MRLTTNNIKEYNQILVNEFAIYPEATQGTPTALAYTLLGLIGEVQEITTEKHIESTAVNENQETTLEKEYGDVLWYLTRMYAELNGENVDTLDDVLIYNELVSFKQNRKHLESFETQRRFGEMSNIVKKYLRKDKAEKNNELSMHLLNIAHIVKNDIYEDTGISDITILLEQNVEKLRGRVKNKTIQGDGDNR